MIKIRPGYKGRKRLPCSEVCMHMKVADKVMGFEFFLDYPHRVPLVQLLKENGSPFSFPILMGEAGIYWDDENGYYFVEEK